MKLGLSSWSLHRQFLNSEVTDFSIWDFPQRASSWFGVKYIEFFEGDYAPSFISDDVDDTYAHRMREACNKADVQVACISAINELTNESEQVWKKDLGRMRKWAAHCKILGCRNLRVNLSNRTIRKARLFDKRLKQLADDPAIRDHDIVLVIENHPYPLATEASAVELVHVLSSLKRSNVKLLPDMGAIEPGVWNVALERLAPYAAHVHLKPFVLEAGGDRIYLPEYAPKLKQILERHNYNGVISYEYTEFLDIQADAYGMTRQGLEQASKAFENKWTPSQLPLIRSEALELKVNSDEELPPRAEVLQLLTDGCETASNAAVRFHDFSQERNYYSRSAAHREDEASPRQASFCELVDQNPEAAMECRNFHRKVLERVKSGQQTAAELCICPMGLVTLSVPVRDESNTKLFGALTAGGWIEEGAEGMALDGIHRLAGREHRQKLKEACSQVPTFSLERLQDTQTHLQNLAVELADTHNRGLAEKKLRENSKIIGRLRELGRSSNIGQFIEGLPEIFAEFGKLFGLNHVVLAHYWNPGDGFEFHMRIDEGDFHLPGTFAVRSHAPKDSLRRLLREYINKVHRGFESISTGHDDGNEFHEFVVFSIRKPRKLSEIESILLDQFAAEVEYTLARLRNLEIAEEHENQREMFIGRVKHALSASMQGLVDRADQLRDQMEANAISRFSIEPLLEDMRDFGREGEAILRRFTAGLNKSGVRPKYRFTKCRPAMILRESARKFRRRAHRLGLTLRFQMSHADVDLEADVFSLGELFDNLIENATRYANSGTSIFVEINESTSCDDEKWTLLTPGLRFTFKDFGLGIPDDELEKIFEPYQQGTLAPARRVQGGTGLGLYVCKEIVTAHGGEITVTSRMLHSYQGDEYYSKMTNCHVAFRIDLPYEVPQDRKEIEL